MTIWTIRDLLAAQPIFEGLAPTDFELLAGCGTNVRFDSGDLLGREDAPADQFFVVRHGRVATELPAPGSPLVVDSAGPGEVVGWSWLFPPHRWATDLRAVEPTAVIAIDARCLRDKCDTDPAFGFRMMSCFALLMRDQLDAMRLRVLDLYGSGRGR
jgi:CRP/FNR family transcriptional regulator, cyclic AMP receptor protein